MFDTRQADENLKNAGCDPQLAKAIGCLTDSQLEELKEMQGKSHTQMELGIKMRELAYKDDGKND